jgi:hypothetical protein
VLPFEYSLRNEYLYAPLFPAPDPGKGDGSPLKTRLFPGFPEFPRIFSFARDAEFTGLGPIFLLFSEKLPVDIRIFRWYHDSQVIRHGNTNVHTAETKERET